MELYRADGLLDPKVAVSKKILFLGLGSLGSLTVANLAYLWREIVLVDPEVLELENIERHLLGRRFLGRPKVEGIADYLIDKGISPETITTQMQRAQEVLKGHKDTDLVIVSIDDQDTLYDINTFCVVNNIPVLFGGIYPRGTGGEVIVITNPNDVCYQCAAHKMDRDTYQGVSVNYGLGEITDTGWPALHWVVNATASDMADFALEILSGKKPAQQVLVRAHNTWEPIIHLGKGEELNALSTYLLNLPDIGFIPNKRLEMLGGRYTLQASRSIFSLVLNRWDECPMHQAGEYFSVDEISKWETDNGSDASTSGGKHCSSSDMEGD